MFGLVDLIALSSIAVKGQIMTSPSQGRTLLTPSLLVALYNYILDHNKLRNGMFCDNYTVEGALAENPLAQHWLALFDRNEINFHHPQVSASIKIILKLTQVGNNFAQFVFFSS